MSSVLVFAGVHFAKFKMADMFMALVDAAAAADAEMMDLLESDDELMDDISGDVIS